MLRLCVSLAGAAAAVGRCRGPGAATPQSVTPGTPEQAPGQPAPHTVNAADRMFLQQAAIGGMAEVALAELVCRGAARRRWRRSPIA